VQLVSSVSSCWGLGGTVRGASVSPSDGEEAGGVVHAAELDSTASRFGEMSTHLRIGLGDLTLHE
jgi:hypothetical protein